MRIIITMEKEQANIVAEALDFYSRWLEGQFEEGASLIRMHMTVPGFKIRKAPVNPDMTSLRMALDTARNIAMPMLERSAYIGIAQSPRVAKIAYDIRARLVHDLAWYYQPGGGIGVDFDEPMHLVKELPLPEVKIVEVFSYTLLKRENEWMRNKLWELGVLDTTTQEIPV